MCSNEHGPHPELKQTRIQVGSRAESILLRLMAMNDEPLLQFQQRVTHVTRDEPADENATVLATRDHAVIQEWAALVGAVPATGERTASGPASSMKVNDGGSGLRFNFPGVARFREISWTEWLDHFNGHDLTFVFENSGGRQPPSARFRLVRTSDLPR